METRTERVYHGVNGNPGISIPGGRQIDSHNNNLKSVKLKIIGQDKQVIYVLYKDETYKIPVMIDKR